MTVITGGLLTMNMELLTNGQPGKVRILRIKPRHIWRRIRRRIIEETLAQPDRSQNRMGILAR